MATSHHFGVGVLRPSAPLCSNYVFEFPLLLITDEPHLSAAVYWSYKSFPEAHLGTQSLSQESMHCRAIVEALGVHPGKQKRSASASQPPVFEQPTK